MFHVRKWSMLFAVVLIIASMGGSFGLLASSAAARGGANDLEGHWAQGVIRSWLNEGLISGYEDGTVRPDEPVTRAEFVSLVNRVFKLPHLTNYTFTDTPENSWYLRDLQSLYAAGGTSGYPDGSFRPMNTIKRQEAAVLVYGLAKEEVEPAGIIDIPDIEQAAVWSREAIESLTGNGYFESDSAFRPTDNLTRAEAITMLDRYRMGRDRLVHADVPSVFTEKFNDKRIEGRQIKNAEGETVWSINETIEQTHAITDNGALELGGARYMQRAELQNREVQQLEDFAMEFTVNLQRMGNEGHSGRPMIAIIPRTKDSSYSEFYGITYYMETTYMGNIVANLFKTRWAIVNTASPSGMEPLAEGFFLLKENVDYIARLTVENTDEGAVKIDFYIDGPTDPVDEYEPLVSYTDTSDYKITSSAAGPAFGMSGRVDDLWGHAPEVRFDRLRVMKLDDYEEWAGWLTRYAMQHPADIEEHPLKKEIKYILNRGLMELDAGNRFNPDRAVSTTEFVDMLRSLSGQTLLPTVSEATLTKSEAASWIYAMDGKPEVNNIYASLLPEMIGKPEEAAVHYVFHKGIMNLEEDGEFQPGKKLTRSETALLLLRRMDAGYRFPHGKLKLPSVLSSGMVLQRDKTIPIWGTGTSGQEITVSFRNQTKKTTVEDGHWYLELEPEPYGGPDKLTVSGLDGKLELTDVLVGEVFVVAGQSNAEMPLNSVNGGDAAIKKFTDKPNLRFYRANQVMAASPRFDDEGDWLPSYDWVLEYSPAIGTFFIEKLLELNDDLKNVPIGLIQTTYGGSTIELFLPDSLMREEGYVQHHDEPIVSGYWNGFMEGISPYAVKAWLYYQGENSTQLGYSYEPLLRAYLRAIREEYRNPALPVFLVQLAGYGDNYYESDIDSWPLIREVQMRVANTTPHTELVTAIDLSDENPLEIHPLDKKPIGERIAYRALETVYGHNVGIRSPEYSTYELNDGRYRIAFRYVQGQLVLRQGREATGFEILDETGKWLPAEAKLVDDSQRVEVWRDTLTNPQGVRYAWRNYPEVTLFDGSGLPAYPFNSTKNVAREQPVPGTDDHHVRIINHFLKSYDAIVNFTRNDTFRMVEVRDGHLLWHEYAIPGQSPGDDIAKLSRLPNLYAAEGTNTTTVRLLNHGLKEGDWVRNNTRGWQVRRVERIVDANTLEVQAVAEQATGDEFERYVLVGTATAIGSFEE